jgi:hypothetical protein
MIFSDFRPPLTTYLRKVFGRPLDPPILPAIPSDEMKIHVTAPPLFNPCKMT